ncbi:hypothetical protein LOTGIDRAFT_158113 [Lottia gigantea]|uniref:Uncharacterized protein n=1 Tax=Lottia gigantea TaxID=225164 RepID=V4CDG7_LOTGI|nr:hypothetical protein LOTGIDRAFT_158113 [Lottia gigantea]ESO99949.1 hypothetical protein LOTGIDRAFT_158113 [Lottia gigantea]
MTPDITLAYFPMGPGFPGFPINPKDAPDVESPGPEYSHMAHLHSDGLNRIHHNSFSGDPSSMDFAGDPIVLEGTNPMHFQHNPIPMGDMRTDQMNYPHHFNPLGDKTHSIINLPRNPMAMGGMPNQMPMGIPSVPTAGIYQQTGFPNQRRSLNKPAFLKGILGNRATGARSNSNTLTRMSSTLQDIGKLMGKNDQSWMTAVRGYFRKMLAQKKLAQQQQQITQQQIQQQRQIRQQQLRQHHMVRYSPEPFFLFPMCAY